jgi:ankyrin repeat protein
MQTSVPLSPIIGVSDTVNHALIEEQSEETKRFFTSVLKGAATAGSIVTTKLALDSSPLTLNSRITPEGATALHLAAKAGKTDYLKWCKDSGGDFAVKDDLGNTLCIYAAATNHWETFMWLATVGCDWMSTNKQSFDNVAYAASQERDDIILFLLQLRSPVPARSHMPQPSHGSSNSLIDLTIDIEKAKDKSES